jgi:hypothetical protein
MEQSYEAPSEEFLAALGALTLNWAAIEAALDFSIAIIFHEYPYDKMGTVPQNLGRKITFVCNGLKHPRLSIIRARGLALCADLQSRKDDRNKIIHGAILGAANGNTIETLRIRYRKHGHSTSVHTVTTAEIEEYAAAALPLTDRATAFSIRLFNVTRPNDVIDYPLGEFAD